MIASVTGGTIVGLVGLAIVLILCFFAIGVGGPMRRGAHYDQSFGAWLFWGGIVVIPVAIGMWWWGMAFTLSGDYHAWNVKRGTVERINNRLISRGEGRVSQRYVAIVNGQALGIDDTRASLLRPGDPVRLKCKKDYEWGVDRSAHGWACRWAASS